MQPVDQPATDSSKLAALLAMAGTTTHTRTDTSNTADTSERGSNVSPA